MFISFRTSASNNVVYMACNYGAESWARRNYLLYGILNNYSETYETYVLTINSTGDTGSYRIRKIS